MISHAPFFFYMQALYFCVPFREQLLDYYSNNKSSGDAEENLLTCLADLFTQVILWGKKVVSILFGFIAHEKEHKNTVPEY